jgi:HlyD family secretion protein
VPGVSTPLEGRVRVASPTVDPQTRNGLVYVDLPHTAMDMGVRPGMFASGQLEQGSTVGLTLPQTAIALQDGFNYVFQLDGRQVRRLKVLVGRREGDRIEVVSGLAPHAQVVAAGVGLLNDGDTVRVVQAAGPGAPSASSGVQP